MLYKYLSEKGEIYIHPIETNLVKVGYGGEGITEDDLPFLLPIVNLGGLLCFEFDDCFIPLDGLIPIKHGNRNRQSLF